MKKYLNPSASVITLSLMLASCTFGSTMPAQLTSMNVGCNDEEVKVTHHYVELNGDEKWTAECNGKVYDCEYMPESGSNCYLRKSEE